MADQPAQGWRVLLVDDDQDDYLITRSMLREAEGRVVQLDWASTYEAGLDALRSNLYDALLVDYDLGARTGIELIREITAQGYSVPLILYTGRGSYEVDVEAIQAGATLYLTKTEANPLLLERFLRYAIERKRIEQERDRHLLERAEILESIQDSFFSVGRDWTITHMNRKAAHYGGKEPEEIIGRNFWEVFPGLLGTEMEKQFRRVMEERIPIWLETPGVFTSVIFNLSIYPSAEGISVFSQDISERKRMDAELRSLALFPGENPNPVMRVSAEGALLYANTAAQTLMKDLGCDEETGLPEDLLSASAEALSAHSMRQLDLDSPDKCYLFVITPIIEQGYVNLYAQDITGRKQAERLNSALGEINRLIHSTLDVDEVMQRTVSASAQALGCDTAAISLRKEGRWVASYVHGFPEEVVGAVMEDDLELHAILAIRTKQPVAVNDAFHDERFNRDHLKAWGVRSVLVVPILLRGEAIGVIFYNYQRAMFEFTQFHIDFGTKLAATLSLALENARLFQELEKEVDRRRAVEQVLQESEERFRTMADGTPVIIWVTDTEGRIEFANRAYQEFFGLTTEQVQSGGWEGLVHPDDQAGYVEVFMDCLRQRRPFRGVGRVRRWDGQWRWVLSDGRPLFSPSGEFIGMAGSSPDITERKEAAALLRERNEALETYAEQLKQSNQALQDFAFIASHDLREPLRKVQAFSAQLGRQANSRLNPADLEYLERMQQAAGRMQKMLDGLLAYS